MTHKNNLLYVLIIGLSLLISAAMLANSKVSVRSTQTNVNKDGSLTNAISVSGDGTSVLKPDMVNIAITITETAQKVSDAQASAAGKIASVVEILKNNGVDLDKLKTTQLSIYPRYDYTRGTRIFRGYDATQSLNVEVDYDEADGVAAKIIDEVSQIEDIQISSISFELKDKEAAVNIARELAYNAAEEKAVQLAKLSGVGLGKPISIIDSSQQFKRSSAQPELMALDMVGNEAAPSAQIFGGELETIVEVHVVFEIN